MRVGKYDITLKNIKSYIKGTTNKLAHDYGLDLLDYHEQVQVAMRSNLCVECKERGACILCHCTTPDMFYDPSKECEGRRWGKMLDEKSWEAFINKNKHKMSVDDIDGIYEEYVESTGGEILKSDDQADSNIESKEVSNLEEEKEQLPMEDDDVVEAQEMTVEEYLALGPRGIVKSKMSVNVEDSRAGFIRFDDPAYPNFTVHDFGTIVSGTPVSYEFIIPNNSGMALRILNIKTSCSCSSATGDQLREVAHGDSFSVKMTFDGRILGKVIRSTEVIIEDMHGGHRQTIALFMKGNVVESLQEVLVEGSN